MLAKDTATMREWIRAHVAPSVRDVVAKCEKYEPLVAKFSVAGLFQQISARICVAEPEGQNNPVRAALQITSERLHEATDRVWAQIAKSLAAECSSCLSAVQNIAVNYRMTRKPAPTTPSTYVENIMAPAKRFLEKHSAAEYPPFLPAIVDSVCAQYLTSVASLLETVRRMDTVIQRRVRAKKPEDSAADTSSSSASKRAATSDSDKVLLQLYLDISRFGDDVRSLGLDPLEFEGFRALKGEVSVAEDFIQ